MSTSHIPTVVQAERAIYYTDRTGDRLYVTSDLGYTSVTALNDGRAITVLLDKDQVAALAKQLVDALQQMI